MVGNFLCCRTRTLGNQFMGGMAHGVFLFAICWELGILGLERGERVSISSVRAPGRGTYAARVLPLFRFILLYSWPWIELNPCLTYSQLKPKDASVHYHHPLQPPADSMRNGVKASCRRFALGATDNRRLARLTRLKMRLDLCPSIYSAL